jgi:chromosome segregation ATPase
MSADKWELDKLNARVDSLSGRVSTLAARQAEDHAQILAQREETTANARQLIAQEKRLDELEFRATENERRTEEIRAQQLTARNDANAFAEYLGRVNDGLNKRVAELERRAATLAQIDRLIDARLDSVCTKLLNDRDSAKALAACMEAADAWLIRRVTELERSVRTQDVEKAAVGGVSDEPVDNNPAGKFCRDASANRDLERIREIQSSCGQRSINDLRPTNEDRAILGTKPGDKFPGGAQLGEQFYRGDPSIPKSAINERSDTVRERPVYTCPECRTIFTP